jgi:hypothetical protein
MIKVKVHGRLFVGLFLFSWALISSSGFASTQASSREKALPCKTSQLSAVNDQEDSDAMDGGVGHHAITIAIENRSSSLRRPASYGESQQSHCPTIHLAAPSR